MGKFVKVSEQKLVSVVLEQ